MVYVYLSNQINISFDSKVSWHSRLGLHNTSTASLQRVKTPPPTIPFPVQNGSSSVQNGNSSVQNGKIIISKNIKNIL